MKNLNDIAVIHSGCDGLTVALQGNASQTAIDMLDKFKVIASELGGEALMEIGGKSFNVMDRGTSAVQGYTFQFHTGRHGIKYQVKRSLDASQWNLRARVSAMFLALNGLEKAHSAIYEDLRALGTVIIDESVSNVDFCVDMKMDKSGTKRAKAFQLDPALFVHHSKATKRQWYSENEGENDTLSVFGNRYIETVTIGGRANRQLCVYNKKAEQKSKRRSDWFEYWGEEKEDCPNIWRVEYRFGRDFLRDWNIRTVSELSHAYGRLVEDSLMRIRYAIPSADSNHSRWKNHPFWEAVISAFSDMILTCELDGFERGKITKAVREDFKNTYSAQMCGLAAGLAHVLDFENIEDIGEKLPSIISQMIAEHLKYKPDRFEQSLKKAKTRMHFLREVEHVPD